MAALPMKFASESNVTVRGSFAITPHDTNELAYITKYLLVDVAGVVKITFEDGTTDTIQLAAGVWHKIAAKIVWSTGTTATGIHGGH